MSVATDKSYSDRNSGQKVDKAECQGAVTFWDRLIGALMNRAGMGRLLHVEGQIQTRRRCRYGDDSDRFSTETIVVLGVRIQLYDTAPIQNFEALEVFMFFAISSTWACPIPARFFASFGACQPLSARRLATSGVRCRSCMPPARTLIASWIPPASTARRRLRHLMLLAAS